jgi:lipopolysaccharide/colanic/teichoic acid biosynthesis glycosyltransferase
MNVIDDVFKWSNIIVVIIGVIITIILLIVNRYNAFVFSIQEIKISIKNDTVIHYPKKSYILLKRIIDILFSILMLCLISPVYVLISLLIKIFSSGKILKTNYNYDSILNRNIPIYSFNTVNLLSLNKFLKRTGLDKFPEFINILKGDFSLVGRSIIPNSESIPLKDKEILKLYPIGILPLSIFIKDQVNYKESLLVNYFYSQRASIGFDFFLILRGVLYAFLYNRV